MKKTISFHPPVIPSTATKVQADLFDRSIEAFENGKYTTSLNDLLDSIHPGARKNQTSKKNTEYHIPHGPLNIRLQADEEKFSITAPLISLSGQETIPLLRQVAMLNFNELDLTRLVLEDNGLYFTFSCPLRYSHPRKIRRVLEEICRAGEKYDYDFRDQFKVERLVSPRFTPYSPRQVEYISEVIHESCRECLEAVRYFETLHQQKEMRLILRTTFLKLLYVAHPQGKLRHTLEKAVSDMDRDLSLTERITDGKAVISQLRELTREELCKDLYYMETFIPDKKRSNLQNLRENYEFCYKQISAFLESGDYRKAGLRIIHQLYETYYQNQMDDDLNTLFANVLRETSDQPWAIAAPALYQLLDNIMQGRIKRVTPPVAA